MAGFLTRMLGIDEAGTLKKIQYLGNAKNPDGIPDLIGYLGHEHTAFRLGACCALEHHWMTGNSDAITALTKALDDSDALVRKDASLALGEFISRSTDTRVCDAAKLAMIGCLKRETAEVVIKGLIVGFASIQDTNLSSHVAEALVGKDKKIISMAIEAIGNMPQTDVRIELKKALRSIL